MFQRPIAPALFDIYLGGKGRIADKGLHGLPGRDFSLDEGSTELHGVIRLGGAGRLGDRDGILDGSRNRDRQSG
jgi:hypothetical protein